MRIWVTGGAGYIGSHFVHYARSRGWQPIVVDDLRRGHASAIPAGTPHLAVALEDRAAVRSALESHRPEAVVHFAGRLDVAESMRLPARYFAENVTTTLGLLEQLVDAGITALVFSSSAAVYGAGEHAPEALHRADSERQVGLPVVPTRLREDARCEPSSAYGETKLQVERMLPYFARAHGLRSIALRYFNAAGAEPAWGTRERHDPETHLIPLAIDAALGRRDKLKVFGTDYPTPDGTALRDYVHVVDLAAAHGAALEALRQGETHAVYNIGTGTGSSVRQVLQAVEAVAGTPVPHEICGRREGDPPSLVADPSKIDRALGFRCHRSDLRSIVQDAYLSRK